MAGAVPHLLYLPVFNGGGSGEQRPWLRADTATSRPRRRSRSILPAAGKESQAVPGSGGIAVQPAAATWCGLRAGKPDTPGPLCSAGR